MKNNSWYKNLFNNGKKIIYWIPSLVNDIFSKDNDLIKNNYIHEHFIDDSENETIDQMMLEFKFNQKNNEQKYVYYKNEKDFIINESLTTVMKNPNHLFFFFIIVFFILIILGFSYWI